MKVFGVFTAGSKSPYLLVDGDFMVQEGGRVKIYHDVSSVSASVVATIHLESGAFVKVLQEEQRAGGTPSHPTNTSHPTNNEPAYVICGRCRQQYDPDVQVPVCPHETIEKVERERKAKAPAQTTPNRSN